MFWSRLIPETTFLHACLEELGGKNWELWAFYSMGVTKGLCALGRTHRFVSTNMLGFFVYRE